MATLKKCLGVDLGSNTVKVVEVAVDREGLKVLAAASAETNVDPNASAEERRDAIARTLRELVKRTKLSTKEAVFGLPGQKVFIRRFRLPETTPERLERIVTYEARQQIPFPVDKTDLQFQFFPIPEEREVEVLLVAVRHDEVQEFMQLVNKAGLTPQAVGVSSFAVFNTHAALRRNVEDTQDRLLTVLRKKKKKGGGRLADILKKKKKAEENGGEADGVAPGDEPTPIFEEVHAFVNLGAAAMDLAVAQMGKSPMLKFSRSVPNAGNDLSRAIMASCDIGSFVDAERIKKHQARLMTFDFDTMEDGNLHREACLAVSQAMDRILSEVRRSLDFFISQPDGMAVDALMISGGQALIPGAVEYVEEKLTIPVSLVAQVPEESGLVWRPQGESLTKYVPAVGLALQGVSMADVSVDFLPEERKITRDFPYRTTAVLVLLLILLVGISSQAGKYYTEKYRDEANALLSTKSQNQSRVTAARNVQDMHNRVADKLTRFAQASGERDYWLDFLAVMESVKPPDVLITRLNFSHDGRVRIEGASEQQRSAADFNERLRALLKEPKQPPALERSDPVRGSQNPLPDIPQAWVFTITFQTSDKWNLMRVTPTPDPSLLAPGGRTGLGLPPRSGVLPRTGAGTGAN